VPAVVRRTGGSFERRGRAIDLRDRDVDPDVVAAAIRARSTESDADRADRLAVRCPPPSPVHEYVGVVRPDRSYPLQAALAAAARQLGHRAPQAEALQAARDRLDAIEVPEPSLAEQRRRVADVADGRDLAEQVATLRGQLEAARDRGDDPAAVADARERAVADLAEQRTERLAAEQALERARESARDARDRREERLELEDRERNLEREARRTLAERLRPAFERALAAVPGDAEPGETPGSVEEDWVAGALAVCRLAPVVAPVAVAVERFPTATAAAAALDAPVVLVEA